MARIPLPANAQVTFDDPAPPSGRMPLPAGAQVTYDDTPAAPGPDPGSLAAVGRGAAQGATFGFADELAGFFKRGLGMSKTYQEGRDEYRKNDKAAQEAHPLAYGAGEVGGGLASSFVPGLNVAKGASGLALASKAAAAGAISGVGSSEHDLLKGDFGGVAQDAAFSGVLGGATAGLASKLTRGAPERVEKRLVGELTDGATATMRDRVVGKEGRKFNQVVDIIKETPGLRQAGNDPQRQLSSIDGALASTMERIDSAYAKAAGVTPGIRVDQVVDDVVTLAAKLKKDPGKASLARALQTKADDIAEAWGHREFVTANEVRTLARDIGDEAFRGSPSVAPKQAQTVVQDMWKGLKGRIDDNIEEAAKALGDQGVIGGAAELRQLNQQASTLMNMRQAAAYRATRDATPSTRLSSRLGGALDLGLAMTDPTSFVAKKAYDFVGKPAMHAADWQLAKIAQAARAGSTPAQIAQLAVEMGIGRTSGEALGMWAAQRFGGSYGASPPPPMQAPGFAPLPEGDPIASR